jgi:hypothetical protein
MNITKAFKAALVVCGLLGVFDLVSLLGAGTDDGPPVFVAVLSTVLGVLTVAVLYWAWSADRRALWAVAVTRTVSALLGVPAFGADIPAGIKVLVAAFIVITAIALVPVVGALRRTRIPS